jgi:hypothetical protein
VYREAGFEPTGERRAIASDPDQMGRIPRTPAVTPNHRARGHVQRPVGSGTSGARPAIMFRDRRAFWVGTGAVIAGVVLHLPMFLGARDMQYRLVGMPVDPGMLAGILAALAVGRFGIETRRRGLEEITAVELRKPLEVR